MPELWERCLKACQEHQAMQMGITTFYKAGNEDEPLTSTTNGYRVAFRDAYTLEVVVMIIQNY